MGITYRDNKVFSVDDLKSLFLSVGWESGKYPDKLQIALKNSGSVFSAWDGDRLVGLINAMDDGVINAYIQYLLVDPQYQGRGIGKELIRLILERYETFMRKTLIAYNHAIGFYQACGFSLGEGKTPLFVSNL